MKKLLLPFILMITSMTCMAQFNFGAGLETDFDILGIKGQIHYQIDDTWAGQVSGTLFFSDFNPTMLNFDAHYRLASIGSGEEIRLNGIGGFNYWSSGVEGAGGELGFNLGGNVTFPVTDQLDGFVEPKVTLISNAAFFMSFGVYF